MSMNRKPTLVEPRLGPLDDEGLIPLRPKRQVARLIESGEFEYFVRVEFGQMEGHATFDEPHQAFAAIDRTLMRYKRARVSLRLVPRYVEA